MTPRRKKRFTVVLLILTGLSMAIGFMVYGLKQNINLFYTPSELIDGRSDGHQPKVGDRIRIGGMVAKDSVVRDNVSLKVEFSLYDQGSHRVYVEFDKILPDLFREEQGIVAQGILIAPNRLRATEVLAKHDEEYLPPEIADAMKRNHKPLEYTKEQQDTSQ